MQTYYRWEKQCIAQVTGAAESGERKVNLVRVNPESLQTVRLPQSGSPAAPGANHVTIRMGEVSIELPARTGVEQIAQLVRALNHA